MFLCNDMCSGYDDNVNDNDDKVLSVQRLFWFLTVRLLVEGSEDTALQWLSNIIIFIHSVLAMLYMKVTPLTTLTVHR